MSELDEYHALSCYTLEHGDPAFIHQHVVDAFTAQHADERTKPIGLTFALIGLYLHVERGFSGREVQRVHMALAKQKRAWPPFALPEHRGSITVIDVTAAAPCAERDDAIDRWCVSVWGAFASHRDTVIALLREHGY
jgi:hypothetical protein